eukprot:Rhum_TRINITY_DN7468_c0_g1::Rhum_TRINITY_DN7468_c0_g1_i1::g.23074::m.23074
MHRSVCVLLAAATAVGRLYEANTDYTVFPNLDCAAFTFSSSCSCSTVVKGSSLQIDNYIQGVTTITCPDCASLGFTTAVDSQSGVLRLSGTGTVEKYTRALKSVQFRSTQDDKDFRVMYNFGGGVMDKSTGHMYDFHHYPVPCPDDHCHWENAQSDCAAEENDILGLIGYLVTVTTREEDQFAHRTLHSQGWMGSTDAGKEDSWRWVTGPEGMMGPDACAPYDTTTTGPRRSSCDIYPLTRSSDPCTATECDKGLLIGTGNTGKGTWIGSSYSNWEPTEPNNYPHACPGDCDITQEDYGHFHVSGEWNDYPYTHNYIEGYVCEWGGIGEPCLVEMQGSAAFVQGCEHYNTQNECENEQSDCFWSNGSCFKQEECACTHSCLNCA